MVQRKDPHCDVRARIKGEKQCLQKFLDLLIFDEKRLKTLALQQIEDGMGFVISRSGVRVTPLAPRNAPKTMVFGAFFYVKSSDFQMAEKFDPHRDPHRAKNAAHRQVSSASRPVRCFSCWKCFYRIPRGIAAYREIYFFWNC